MLGNTCQESKSDFDWSEGASRLLRAEMVLAGVSSAKLARRITRLGVAESEASVKNKLYRGSFSLAFFLQAMAALGHSSVDLGKVVPKNIKSGLALDGPADSVK